MSFRQVDSPVWLNDNFWSCRRHFPSAHFPAAVEKCLYGCKILRPEKSETPVPKPVVEGWQRLIMADSSVLWGARIMELRAYARHHLGLVGVSKIRGGKTVLIPLILRTRQLAA